MYYSTHLVIGASVGAVTGHPVKAFIAGLASHIVLDLIPHHDHERVINCVVDVVGSTIIFAIWFLYAQPGLSVLVGAVAGVLPDIEIPLYYYKYIEKRYFPSHTGWIPHKRSVKDGNGILIQLVFIGLGVWAIG